MNNEVESNIDMANKDHIVLSCDTLGTTVPEARHNLQMSSLTKIEIEIECVNEKVSHYNNCEDSSEHIQSSEYVNYYDNEIYVVEQLKTEFPEDVLPQSDCSVNNQIHSENKDLLKFIAKAELNNENIEDRLSLNIKKEDDYNEYRFIVKTEGLEKQEDVKCKFYNNTLENVESTKASTTEVQTITSRKIKKTNAQRCREYRERKKLQNTMVQNITAERSDECSETNQLPAKKPKTNAERRKKYYEAQKLKKQKIKKIPKTAKQRNKEYYYRKKKFQALNTLNHHSDVSRDNCSAEICKHPEEIRNNAEETQQNNSFIATVFRGRINNNPAESTTKYNTTIDAVFSRDLNKIESQTYVKIEPTD